MQRAPRINRSPGWLCILLAFGSMGHAFAAPRYDIVPIPQWVQPADLHAAENAGSAQDEVGARYILVDRQIRAGDTRAEFVHFVTRLNNPTGVEDNSQITID